MTDNFSLINRLYSELKSTASTWSAGSTFHATVLEEI